MRVPLNTFQKLVYSCKEIGIPHLSEYALYVLQKRSGLVAGQTPPGGLRLDFDPVGCEPFFPFPNIDQKSPVVESANQNQVLQDAGEILDGWYHPFGGEKQRLEFVPHEDELKHWSQYGDTVNGQDIKWIWEPARFSWAFTLARAYLIRLDDEYVKCFWMLFKSFLNTNPVNRGANWTSAQEAAMRIVTWTMVFQVFRKSPATTAENIRLLSEAIWQHAARIPPTLTYARSQNNNHLLSEAVGLIAAGTAFSQKSKTAARWVKLGFREFTSGLIRQIETDGTYAQHSANYHRLMLQLCLIYYVYAKFYQMEIPSKVASRLSAATCWMAAQLEPQTGRLPNLGHNDGTLMLPMGCEDYRDYRPTAQAASLAFLGTPCLPHGAWDELASWFGLLDNQPKTELRAVRSPAVHQIIRPDSRAILRGVKFHGRPAHADQLHLDIWWEGINIAQDAGTFAYNDAPPWQNPFTTTLVHNALSINGNDQMRRAGKFLWLHQAQAEWLTSDSRTLTARHNGYREMGVIHQRKVEFIEEGLLRTTDLVQFWRKTGQCQVLIHWLLPDWDWKLERQNLVIEQDKHHIEISTTASLIQNGLLLAPDDLSLIRAGETLLGHRKNEILGWNSTTYGVKNPALSFSALFQTSSDLQIITDWAFFKTSAKKKD